MAMYGKIILNASRLAVELIKGWERGSAEAGAILHDLMLDEGATEDQCRWVFSNHLVWDCLDGRVTIWVG